MRAATLASVVICGIAALGACRASRALERIVLTADAVTTPAARATGVRLALDLTSPAPSLRVGAATVDLAPALMRGLAAAAGPGVIAAHYTALAVTCARLEVSSPRLACAGARLALHGGLIDPLAGRGEMTLDTGRRTLDFKLSDLPVAGGHGRLAGRIAPDRWALQASATALDVTALRALASHWIELPPGYSATGLLDLDLDGDSRPGRSVPSGGRTLHLAATVRTAALGFANAAGTIGAERLAGTVAVDSETSGGATSLKLDAVGTGGQLLAGPVLADFHANPLSLHASGVLSGRTLQIDALSLAQRALIAASGTGRVTLASGPGARPTVDLAQLSVESLEFPAAYTTFLQLPLAATDFAALRTSGKASGRLEIAANRPVRIDAAFQRLEIEDPASRLAASDLRGDLHWAADGGSPSSFVSFKHGRAYGIELGATRLDFTAQGADFHLAHETRIPVFDGAIVIHSLAASALGRPDAQLRFDASIEPIGMPRLCKAFGWPQMQGSLSGRIPGLAYEGRELTFGGDVVAHLFDGTVTGANIRLVDPFGPWPRLHADVTARNLDLELVTRTYPIGSITGRLDADVSGLELFDWSPVAFDARLYTTPGDRSRHRISQKAVTSLSNVGGGGGGVAAALQSGFLRFFDTFHYDKIGLRCALHNEVCLMSGIEPARNGYYIVKGRGLPRIDIIGNQGRVNWPQLVTQIVSAMHSGNVVVH